MTSLHLQVTPNLYGNLVANAAAGIAGGTGVMPGGMYLSQNPNKLWKVFIFKKSLIYMLFVFSGNVGVDHAIFEQGASAGNVGDEEILENKHANPVALLLSSAMMLRHLQFPSFADRLEIAVKNVIEEGKYRTKDLGGNSTTEEVTLAVISALR